MSLLKIAHVPPPRVEATATVLDAVLTMAAEGVGAVAVVESGELRGIFTERDVMLRVVLRGRNPRQTRVADVMTSAVETVTEDTTEEDALVQMLERHIRHLPVVGQDRRLKGMLSIRSLLEHRVDVLVRELHSLDQYLANDGPGG